MIKPIKVGFALKVQDELAPEPQMPINADYHGPGELPEIVPVFPLPGALLLPRSQMPLNIFGLFVKSCG